MKRAARIGITMGDPAGIGPEITVRALMELIGRTDVDAGYAVIGTRRCIDDALSLTGSPLRLAGDERGVARPDVLMIESDRAREPLAPGKVSAEAGRLAARAIEVAVDLAMGGGIDAIVTAPISKEAINLAGYRYSGHTEMLAALTGSADSCLMLAHDKLFVSHVTTHVALSEVPKRVTRERVDRVIALTHQVLLRLGIGEPRIAVAALNPHAGEGGLFGREDEEVLVPAIRFATERGMRIEGPVPGDTVFVKALGGQYDAVIAMFHDQGHIPVKLLGFRVDPATGRWTSLRGVNVTLGLPIVRTSPDHGTAFDIAGEGRANARSLIDAIEFALRLVAPASRKQ